MASWRSKSGWEVSEVNADLRARYDATGAPHGGTLALPELPKTASALESVIKRSHVAGGFHR
jgi:hypothetical protein